MKKVMITGGNGFIGRNLREQLAGEYEIYAPLRQELDLLDENAVSGYLDKHYFDVIIHCATQNGSRNAEEPLDLVLDRNLRMFFNLIRKSNCYGKMYVLGSGAEYDIRHYKPSMVESFFDVHVPVDGYGFSKYIMSRYAETVDNIYILRIFGCFGPYEDWEIRFISNAICKVLFGMPITVKKNVYFDYLYINDFVRIMRWFIEGQPIYKHYNVCNGSRIDLLTLAEIVRRIAGKPDLPIVVGEPGLKPEYTGGNSRLLEEMGGFSFTPVETAVEELYHWYEQHIDFIDRNKLLIDK